MAELAIGSLEDDLMARLRARARQRRWSPEAEVRPILRDAVISGRAFEYGLGGEIAECFRQHGFEEGEIREKRGFTIEPPKFDE